MALAEGNEDELWAALLLIDRPAKHERIRPTTRRRFVQGQVGLHAPRELSAVLAGGLAAAKLVGREPALDIDQLAGRNGYLLDPLACVALHLLQPHVRVENDGKDAAPPIWPPLSPRRREARSSR